MSDRITMMIGTACLVVFLTGSALLAGVVQQKRTALELVAPTLGTSSIPPHVAITTAALGTFRGLAVDALWIRADHLEERGEYYEAQTLANWITKLQPRFESVWSFQAWNMAYNICVASDIPEERWRWVARGIDLLRGEGIPLNPKAANLYFDLSWLFRQKIGRVGDKEHWYYKARLATEMQEVLGDLTSGRTKDEAIERFRRIATAPERLEDLLTAEPQMQDVVARLDSLGLAPNEDLVRMLGRVLMTKGSSDAKLLGRETLPAGTNVALLKMLREDEAFSAGLVETLVPHLQRRILTDRYHMDVEKMLNVMETYGPLDWRHFLAHAIYWTEEGVQVSRSLTRREDVNELMLVRGRLIVLMELIRQGKIDVDSATNRVDLLPDPRFCRAFEDSIAEAFAMVESEEGIETSVYGKAERKDFFMAYERFLNVAVMLSYLYGDEAEAERYFLSLRRLMAERDLGNLPLYAGTLANFVAMKFSDQIEVDLADLRQFIDAMLRRGIADGLGKGDFKMFNRLLGVAYEVYDRRYSAKNPNAKFTLKDAKLLEFPKLVENSFSGFFQDASLPVLTRARAWMWTPDQIKRKVYDELKDKLVQASVDADLDPTRAFPPPSEIEPEVVSNESLIEDESPGLSTFD